MAGEFSFEINSGNGVFLVILRSLIAFMAAGVGGFIAMGKKQVSHKVLCGLVSFAAGALLAVTLLHIMPETLELLGFYPGLFSLVGGTLVFAGIGKYVYFLCPACSASEHEGGYLRLGILMMVAMGIHSTVDGLAISAGSVASSHAGVISSVGILILFAVSYHKVPEGMALVSVARLAGYSRIKSLVITLIIEMTTAVGALAGLFLLRNVNTQWLGITLGLVAGSFLYTVGFALLKEMYAHEKGSILKYVAFGFASIVAVSAVLKYAGLAVHSH